MFFQIRKFSFTVIHSTMIALPAWCKACVANNLPIRLIPHDVKTHWNSTFNMVKMALKYCAAVDDITANKGLKLCKYELDDDDWEIVSDLLRIYKDTTLFFSQDTVSTIAHVIPTMDCIDALLNNAVAKPLSLSVKHALAFAHQIINKYYSKTSVRHG
ncbi:hypothetical protein BC827DRAFT_1130418 [Russula dissimulans]|nr:hypothetical protein BC827DRAFT_1130418 [Russula dissimulans]